MKLAGIAGRGSGKMGTMVFASVGGEQVVRQYQPSVANPNTSAQVQHRSKFKLMSQLSAAVADQIAIPKQGMQSSRNLFVKKNIGSVSVENGAAVIPYADLQFTAGSITLPSLYAGRETGSVNVNFAERANINRAVYLIYEKTPQESLRFVNSAIIEEPGEYNDFPAEINTPDNVDLVVYAYGMRDMGTNATAKYGNYNVTTGTALASLIANRTLGASDFQITATTGVTLFSGQPDTDTQAIVSLSFRVRRGSTIENQIILPEGSQSLTGVTEIQSLSVNVSSTVDHAATCTLKFEPTEGDSIEFNNLFVSTSGMSMAVIGATYDVADFQGIPGEWTLTIDGHEFPMEVTA